MKLYAPEYYKDFVCIADKCTHSCCIGWEIDVDSKTLEKYTALTEGYGVNINQSIDRKDVPHFVLSADERCPHLDCKGLCKIILRYGEDFLCDICREHPRFYNETVNGKEVGLGLACEEAGRIILGSDGYKNLVEISDTEDNCPPSTTFNVLPFRDSIFSILSDSSLSYTKRLERIYEEYQISPENLSDDEWRDIISSLEYLDESHKNLFGCYSSKINIPKEIEKPLERTLAYFIYRHCTKAYDEADLRASLGFCLFCERLLASVANAQKSCDTASLVKLARIISEELEYSEDNTETIKFEFAF